MSGEEVAQKIRKMGGVKLLHRGKHFLRYGELREKVRSAEFQRTAPKADENR